VLKSEQTTEPSHLSSKGMKPLNYDDRSNLKCTCTMVCGHENETRVCGGFEDYNDTLANYFGAEVSSVNFSFLVTLSPKKLICLPLIQNYWCNCLVLHFIWQTYIWFSTFSACSYFKTANICNFWLLSRWNGEHAFFLLDFSCSIIQMADKPFNFSFSFFFFSCSIFRMANKAIFLVCFFIRPFFICYYRNLVWGEEMGNEGEKNTRRRVELC